MAGIYIMDPQQEQIILLPKAFARRGGTAFPNLPCNLNFITRKPETTGNIEEVDLHKVK